MKYFFVLGSNPTLSIAEISAVFGLDKNSKAEIVNQEIFTMEHGEDFNPAEMIKKMGGVIKIGVILDEMSYDQTKMITAASKLIDTSYEGKLKFGISHYGGKKLNLKVIGMEVKKLLKEKGASVRWVTSKERILSSVVVEQNKIILQGAEINIIQNNNYILIGKTLAVQPFKELSYRDYGRPSRDDLSGMIPPKLAQIMINLAAAETRHNLSLLDPFCGSGTILSEAILMGYKNLIGSDISPKAVHDTKQNIEWIASKFQISNYKLQVTNTSATELSKHLGQNSIDLIVTEPFLGPQRGRVDLNKIIPELEQLYSKSISEFDKIIKSGGRVAMVWPVFRALHNFQCITPDLNNFKITNPIPKIFQENKIINLSGRNTIIYGRDQQQVWREIVILEK